MQQPKYALRGCKIAYKEGESPMGAINRVLLLWRGARKELFVIFCIFRDVLSSTVFYLATFHVLH